MFRFSESQNIWCAPVIFDGGDSPFIANNLASLAIGMPSIRAAAQVGDIVLGLAKLGEAIQLTYIFQIDKIISWENYSALTRATTPESVDLTDFPHFTESADFSGRVPKNIIDHGDSIYPPKGQNPLPSWAGRTPADYDIDVIQGKNVLLSRTFCYFGRGDQYAITIPAELVNLPPFGCQQIRSEAEKTKLFAFLRAQLDQYGLSRAGKYGEPLHLPQLEGIDFVMSCNTLSADADGCGSQVQGRVLLDDLRDLQRMHDAAAPR